MASILNICREDMKLVFYYVFLTTVVNLSLANEQNPCKSPGIIADEKDCTCFKICAGSPGNASVASKGQCPPDSVFSEEAKTCVDSYKKPECKVKTRVRRQDLSTSSSCSTLGPHCEGCDRYVVCANIKNRSIIVGELSCSQTGANRICKNNVCTDASQGDQCTVPTPFRCLAPGIYPDVADCKRYHVCTDTLQHFTDVCDQYYDACNGSCTDLPASPPGSVVACQTTATPFPCNKDSTISYFVQCPQYYSLCIPRREPSSTTVTYEVSVMRCPDTYVFDSNTRMCRVSCGNKRTRIPVPDDCHAYLDCSGENKAPERFTCRPGTAFDAVRRMCLPEAQVAACQKVTNVPTPTPTVPPKATESTPCELGQRIPHPNIKRYYECTRTATGSLEMVAQDCPYAMCFNKFLKQCRFNFFLGGMNCL